VRYVEWFHVTKAGEVDVRSGASPPRCGGPAIELVELELVALHAHPLQVGVHRLAPPPGSATTTPAASTGAGGTAPTLRAVDAARVCRLKAPKLLQGGGQVAFASYRVTDGRFLPFYWARLTVDLLKSSKLEDCRPPFDPRGKPRRRTPNDIGA